MCTIAKTMYLLMKEHNMNHVSMGDLHLLEECAQLCHIKKKHPQKMIQSILNGLEKSELFTKGYLYAEHNGRMQKFRCFTPVSNIKKPPRNC